MFSLRDETILDLQAIYLKSKKSRTLDHHILKSGKERLLKAVAIYGANASGKSNIIKSLSAAVEMILHSHTYNENTSFAFSPFKFSGQKEPSEFGMRFLLEGKEYEYGFTAIDDRILTEYLYSYPAGRKSMVFERDETKGPNKKDVYKFRYQIPRPLDVATNTSTKTLFLSRGSQMDRDVLKKIYMFFAEKVIIGYKKVSAEILSKLTPENKASLLDVLKVADSDIADFYISDNRVITTHAGHPDVPFDLLTEESRGTVKLFNIAMSLIDVVGGQKTLFVDEIENSLHSALMDSILSSFYKSEGAQIVFTSHNTHLLNLDKLRKDQIYFTNKRIDGSTELYSLAEFKDFDEHAPLEKAYMQGMFDAVPIVCEPLVQYGTSAISEGALNID